jgi:hypothetical protein
LGSSRRTFGSREPWGNPAVGELYLGYADTSMVRELDAPDDDPADVARQIVDGITSGASELLVDEFTRQARVRLRRIRATSTACAAKIDKLMRHAELLSK